MNEEEKKAIEYYQNKEVSFSVDLDTEKLLKALGITEEDSFENHQIRFKTVLNLIEKLQKENEELKNQEATQRKINELLVQRYSNSISLQKIKDNLIKYQEEYELLLEHQSGKESNKTKTLRGRIHMCQELLEGRK